MNCQTRVKVRVGKLSLPEPPMRFIATWARNPDLVPLPFQEEDGARDVILPRLHGDPFDRGLVSQAIRRNLTIVTPDPLIRRYPVPVLWQ